MSQVISRYANFSIINLCWPPGIIWLIVLNVYDILFSYDYINYRWACAVWNGLLTYLWKIVWFMHNGQWTMKIIVRVEKKIRVFLYFVFLDFFFAFFTIFLNLFIWVRTVLTLMGISMLIIVFVTFEAFKTLMGSVFLCIRRNESRSGM